MLKALAVGMLLALSGCIAYVPIDTAAVQVAGSTCYAGFYICPAAGPVGAPCSCPGIGAPSFGVIR